MFVGQPRNSKLGFELLRTIQLPHLFILYYWRRFKSALCIQIIRHMSMRIYKLEQWYRIPEKETIILNTNHLFGRHRFVIRTCDVSHAHAQVKTMLHTMCKDTWESWNVGSGYPGAPSYFLALSMQDELTAMQFELTFC